VSQQIGEGQSVGKVCRSFFSASSQGRLTRLVTHQSSIAMISTGCKTNKNLVRRHVLPSPAPVLRSSRVPRTYLNANPRIQHHPERNSQHRTPACALSVSLAIFTGNDIANTSQASLPSGEGPARFSPTAVKDWQPRRKSVSNACERCRRRKIRCDGETPCSTCKRFTIQCVRTQKPKEVVASSVAIRKRVVA
jgi:hypothetical protein